MINNPTEIAMKIGYRYFNYSIDVVTFNEKMASIKFINGYLLQITVKKGQLFYEFENINDIEEI